MKLRIRGNSLRLRLLRGEVKRFGADGSITESIQFGGQLEARLTYSLEARGEAREISAEFANNRITVVIPEKIAENWVESELITLQAEQSIENNSSDNVLKILVEKDFVCLDRQADPDNVDAFPHPTGKCGVK